jgi:hypothetical protein
VMVCSVSASACGERVFRKVRLLGDCSWGRWRLSEGLSGEWWWVVCMAEAVVGNVRVMVGQWSNCPRGSELEVRVRQDDVWWWWLVVGVVGSRSAPYENCMGYVSLKAGGERNSAGELRRRMPDAKKKRGLKGCLAGRLAGWAWAEKRKRKGNKQE